MSDSNRDENESRGNYEEVAMRSFLSRYSTTPEAIRSVRSSEGDVKTLEKLSSLILKVDLKTAAYKYIETRGFDNLDQNNPQIGEIESEMFIRSVLYFNLYNSWNRIVVEIKDVLRGEV